MHNSDLWVRLFFWSHGNWVWVRWEQELEHTNAGHEHAGSYSLWQYYKCARACMHARKLGWDGASLYFPQLKVRSVPDSDQLERSGPSTVMCWNHARAVTSESVPLLNIVPGFCAALSRVATLELTFGANYQIPDDVELLSSSRGPFLRFTRAQQRSAEEKPFLCFMRIAWQRIVFLTFPAVSCCLGQSDICHGWERHAAGCSRTGLPKVQSSGTDSHILYCALRKRIWS